MRKKLLFNEVDRYVMNHFSSDYSKSLRLKISLMKFKREVVDTLPFRLAKRFIYWF